MARLGCYCGAGMSNTECPSPHRLNIFLKSEVDAAISYNPDISLWDFYTGWDESAECRNSFQKRFEPVEYWHCTECGRIFEVQAVSCGRIIRGFKPVSFSAEDACNLEGFEELFVLWDIEMDEYLGIDRDDPLRDYISGVWIKHYISPDCKTVYIFDATENKITGKYILDPRNRGCN